MNPSDQSFQGSAVWMLLQSLETLWRVFDVMPNHASYRLVAWAPEQDHYVRRSQCPSAKDDLLRKGEGFRDPEKSCSDMRVMPFGREVENRGAEREALLQALQRGFEWVSGFCGSGLSDEADTEGVTGIIFDRCVHY